MSNCNYTHPVQGCFIPSDTSLDQVSINIHVIYNSEGQSIGQAYTLPDSNQTPIDIATYLGGGSVASGNCNEGVNTVDHALIDGYSATLSGCSSWSFAWGSGGAGSFTFTIVSTGRVVTYTYPDFPSINNAVDWSRVTLEDITFDATRATELYLSTQDCNIPVYEGLPEMIMEVNVTATDVFALPLDTGFIYDFDVDYGEGGGWERVEAFDDATASHTYAGTGLFDIKIRGYVESFAVGSDDTIDTKIVDLKQWGKLLGLTTLNFDGCANLLVTATDGLDTSEFINMEYLFRNCSSLTTVPGIEIWDTSNVTGMRNAFTFSSFNQDISAWDVSQVTSMHSMFRGTTLFNQDINAWDTGNVTTMNAMFFTAVAFNSPVDNWDMGKVIDTRSMFEGGSNPFNQSVEGWNLDSAVDMEWTFANPNYNQPMNNLDVSNVINMGNLFRGSTSFNQPLDLWTPTSCTNFSHMFRDATAFDQDISAWPITSVTSMSSMFLNVTLSTVNYDLILVGWEAQLVNDNITVSFGGSQYSLLSAAATAKADLIADHTWTITDGGGV